MSVNRHSISIDDEAERKLQELVEITNSDFSFVVSTALDYLYNEKNSLTKVFKRKNVSKNIEVI